MGYRLTWTNNSDGHTGSHVYRSTATMDPQALPAPVGTADPVAQGAQAEFTSAADLAPGTHYFRVQDFDGTGVGTVSDEQTLEVVETLPAGTSIGDYTNGGVYAGVDTINGTDYHIIAGMEDSEPAYSNDLTWKIDQTATAGTDSVSDGLANTQAMQSAGISSHPAAQHCVNYSGGGYTDWHFGAESQMLLVYNNLNNHPEFSTNKASGRYTWGSNQNTSNLSRAFIIRFSDGASGTGFKDSSSVYVRPIRRFEA